MSPVHKGEKRTLAPRGVTDFGIPWPWETHGAIKEIRQNLFKAISRRERRGSDSRASNRASILCHPRVRFAFSGVREEQSFNGRSLCQVLGGGEGVHNTTFRSAAKHHYRVFFFLASPFLQQLDKFACQSSSCCHRRQYGKHTLTRQFSVIRTTDSSRSWTNLGPAPSLNILCEIPFTRILFCPFFFLLENIGRTGKENSREKIIYKTCIFFLSLSPGKIDKFCCGFRLLLTSLFRLFFKSSLR